MNCRFTALAVLAVCSLASTNLFAQGAALQAVRGAAQAVEKKVADDQAGLTTGPKDPQEVVSPGKIDQGASKQFTKLPSGLSYRILRKGKGKKPKATQTVMAHYKGWLDNKTVFDSSYRRGQPLRLPLNRVIPGWQEGMQLVAEGGMIELAIPYKLGYGERGTPGGPIPPRANLHFIVELIKIQ